MLLFNFGKRRFNDGSNNIYTKATTINNAWTFCYRYFSVSCLNSELSDCEKLSAINTLKGFG